MPYINREARKRWENSLTRMQYVFNDEGPVYAGELNYLITKIITFYLEKYGLTYASINNVMGVLSCIPHEMYNRLFYPYEVYKRQEHGDVLPQFIDLQIKGREKQAVGSPD